MGTRRIKSFYLVSWEINSDNTKGIKEKARDLKIVIKERPEEFPRPAGKPYSFEGKDKGFQIFQTDLVRLENLMNFWYPEIVMTFERIYETSLSEMDESESEDAKRASDERLIRVQ